MTPQERRLIDELFDRLARLETAPRDGEAERAIADGIARAPHAVYPLVQTVLVQDEALKRADTHIRELTGESSGSSSAGGFLDSMRQALVGRTGTASVPSVHASASTEPDARWNSGAAVAPAAPAHGGSFLGTAAASAAGVIGGALLLNTISSMFGHHGASALAPLPQGNSSWAGDGSGGNLAREAGIDDIGNGVGGIAQSAGLFNDDDTSDAADFDGSNDGDTGGDFGGGDDA
jgi:hypothetical protein